MTRDEVAMQWYVRTYAVNELEAKNVESPILIRPKPLSVSDF